MIVPKCEHGVAGGMFGDLDGGGMPCIACSSRQLTFRTKPKAARRPQPQPARKQTIMCPTCHGSGRIDE